MQFISAQKTLIIIELHLITRSTKTKRNIIFLAVLLYSAYYFQYMLKVSLKYYVRFVIYTQLIKIARQGRIACRHRYYYGAQ